MFMVSGLISTNTGVAPRSTKASAVDTKVKAGMMTSSPGPISGSRSAASSVAWVQEVVSRHLAVPVLLSSHSLHFFVYAPSPQIFWFLTHS